MLIKDILNVSDGCTLMNVNTCCIGYADDIAILASSQLCAQNMVDIAYNMSNKFRFDFSIKKCTVLNFSKKCKDIVLQLGNSNIPIVNEYCHVGVVLRSKGKISVGNIKNCIDQSKRAFYSVIGCSLYKSSLSPLAISKVYWSVSIPKLLSNAEVRHFSDRELEEYEKFHYSMAKNIQNIPQNAPNVSALATLGWISIANYIDYVRLMFLHRLLMLNPMSIHRQIVVKRIFFILINGVYTNLSPIANCLKVCMKYNLIHIILSWLEIGVIPSKCEWKKTVKKCITDVNHSRWRFEICLYPKLKFLRIVHSNTQTSCWWLLARSLPFLKRPCCTIIRLLCGSNVLAVNSKCDKPRSARICENCALNRVEDLMHFIMYCNINNHIREELMLSIQNQLSFEGWELWRQLSDEMKMYILLGMQFPFSREDLFAIRYGSCIALHKMYFHRRSFEPP